MVLDVIQSYFKSNVEPLESELTNLSLNNDEFVYDNQLIEIRNRYKNNVYVELDTDKLTDDIRYYIDMYLEQWFMNSFNIINIINHGDHGFCESKLKLL